MYNVIKLTINISDTYDFDYTDWRDESGSGQIIAIMNDIGALAQAKGAIVPYEIQVTINTTMIERVIELNRIDPPTQLLK